MPNRFVSPATAVLALCIACTARGGESSGRLYPSVSLTSDYRYNGVSYSDTEPAWQGSLYWWRPDRFYAGLWTSQVDFDDPGNTSIEVDLYAGRHLELGPARWTLEVLYTFFPNKTFPGPTYDFIQAKTSVRRPIGRWEVGATGAWSPEASYGSGTAILAQVEGAYTWSKGLKATANLGRRWIEYGTDRTYWDAGVILTLKKVSLDLRYVDTNLNPQRCGGRSVCDGSTVATITYHFR